MGKAAIEYTDEGAAKVFRWQGGPYIDVGHYEAGADGGREYQTEDVISVWKVQEQGSVFESVLPVLADDSEAAAGSVPDARIVPLLKRFEEVCREYLRSWELRRDLDAWAERVAREANDWHGQLSTGGRILLQRYSTALRSLNVLGEEAHRLWSELNERRDTNDEADIESIGVDISHDEDDQAQPATTRPTSRDLGWGSWARRPTDPGESA